MTVKQQFEQTLFNMGLFEDQASQIMELAMPRFAELLPQYSVTWDRPASEYPEAFYNVAFQFVVRKAAVEWIDTNLPNAWYRA